MITTATEYNANLFKILDENAPQLAVLLPSTENVYEINLNKRTVLTPEFLSVLTDHTAETIYFKVDRYFDHTDLSTTTCVIQYTCDGDPDKKGYVYAVPFYDITTCSDEKKILFPWVIGGNATKYSGKITYSIRFYRIDEKGKYFEYILNTLPVTSKILYGMNLSELEGEVESDDNYSTLLDLVQKVKDLLDRNELDLYWIE